MPLPVKKIFCFGYGYSCDALGERLNSDNLAKWILAGTTRRKTRAAALKKQGVTPYIFDRNQPLADAEYILNDVTHLLISTPPDDDGDPAFLAHARDIAKLKNLEWVGYLSTTGVYGDRGGRWVDESCEVHPTSRRGSRRVKAEEQWLSLLHSHNVPVHIFRLAGIYGPGRCALDSVRAGIARRIHKRGHAFGRIHVEDIANVILKSIHNPNPGSIYNLCDDMPAPSHDVIEYTCNLLDTTPPPMVEFEEANLAPMTRSFYSENRRVRNDKIKQDLGVELIYPDYMAGITGCYNAEKNSAAGGLSDQSQEGFDRTGCQTIPAIFRTNGQ